MEFLPIERTGTTFQPHVTTNNIQAMCRRIFGQGVRVASAIELSGGVYNNTYRVQIGEDRPVILRVAPEPARQFRIERELMRNEYASIPYLAPIAPMIPRTLGVDFTHQVIDRDYLFQSLLEGIPGPEGIGTYPKAQLTSFFRQLGEIARRIHGVRGDRFGPVSGSQFDTWSEAVAGYFRELTADLDDAGLRAVDARKVAAAVEKDRAVLDEITEPRLLHGDLWTVNVMMASGVAEPTITGVFDNDRTFWGDPAADWSNYMAAKKPGTERDEFWTAYGPQPSSPEAARRSLFYRARHIGAIRLERHRLGNLDAVTETYEQMESVLDEIQA